LAVLHLAPKARIAGQMLDPLCLQRLGHQLVGVARVNADQQRTLAEVGLTSSQVKRYLRVGLSLSDSQTAGPGAGSPSIAPGVGGAVSPSIERVWGQVAVMSRPSSSLTSARKRL